MYTYRNELNLMPGSGCSAALKRRIKNALLMKPEQVAKVPFAAEPDSYVVSGETENYLVKRVEVIDGVCPGMRISILENEELDTESVLEPCKTYDVFSICQHTFSCECADYSKGNDCKHLLLGKTKKRYTI